MRTKDIFQYSLAALVVLVFFALIFVVFRFALPKENAEIGYMVIGALVMKFGDVVAYFFNSTKGSADKTEMISKGTMPSELPIGFTTIIDDIKYKWDGKKFNKVEL